MIIDSLWIKDVPFRLDTLPSLILYVFPASHQTVCDDKSGYDHIFLSHDSRTYFEYMPSNASAYVVLPSEEKRSFSKAASAIFIVSYTLISLGYFLGLKNKWVL